MSGLAANGLPPAPARVLVSKLGHIGDVLVITPFLKALKDLFPHVQITVLLNQGTEEMALGCAYADQVFMVKRGQRPFLQKLKDSLSLITELRKHPFDMSFELSAGDRGTYMCRVAGAALRVGFDSGEKHVRDRLLHVLLPRYEQGCHEVENFLRQLSVFGKPFSAPALQWRPPEKAQQQADEIIDYYGLDEYILLHPTSRWMFKAWTPEKNARVIEYLAARGHKLVLSAGPDAKEMQYVQQMLNGMNAKVVNLAGKLSLSSLGALIGKARLFFGVDSAPMHLAAAMQTPTVVLFGPSGEHMWGPWQVKHKVVSGICHIRPCGRDGCNGSKICRSLVELPVAQVCQAIEQLLAESAT